MNNTHKFLQLRQEYPFLSFDSFEIEVRQQGLSITFHFNLSETFYFHPILDIPTRPFYQDLNLLAADPYFRQLVFQVGMTELISYWKTACPPLVLIRPYSLSQKTTQWWQKLYHRGLGEFFHVNGIHSRQEEMMHLSSEGAMLNLKSDRKFTEDYLVPVGGGKDSAVTLELLRHHYQVKPFLLNPRKAMTDTVRQAGFDESDSVVFYRTLDPQLIKMNSLGFLNGHTPFSALLAFQTLLAAYLSGNRNIALSNEASANESTLPGTEINHQYSKTYEFERDFREYIRDVLQIDINYFSFLRPLSELQIAGLFSSFSKYFPVFKSCNAGSKNDSWCGECPKCLFAFLILSPYLPLATLVEIFGENLLEKESQWEHLRQLAGDTDEKPFECIGTLDEVNAALVLLLRNQQTESLPLLLKKYRETPIYLKYQNLDPAAFKAFWNHQHFLSPPLQVLLKEAWRNFSS